MLPEAPADKRLCEKIVALKRVNFLPVRFGSGELSLQSVSTEFTLVDNLRYGDAFHTVANTLDFTFYETQRLRRFIVLLGLDSRYLSLNVEESCEVDGDAAFSE